VSIRACARSRGVSLVAVLKASKAGWIPRKAEGSIDPAKADDDHLSGCPWPYRAW
jgi:hypothetical protein